MTALGSSTTPAASPARSHGLRMWPALAWQTNTAQPAAISAPVTAYAIAASVSGSSVTPSAISRGTSCR